MAKQQAIPAHVHLQAMLEAESRLDVLASQLFDEAIVLGRQSKDLDEALDAARRDFRRAESKYYKALKREAKQA